MSLLVADIGGTQARFRLIEAGDSGWHARHTSDSSSRQFGSLGEAVAHYLAGLTRIERADIRAAWLAVAGPVHGRQARFSNLPWRADADALCAELRLPAVHLVNDLEALAHGVASLPEEKLIPIRKGFGDGGCQMVISSGTGLGVAAWRLQGDHIEVFPSEGGHCDLAPVTPTHCELLRYLHGEYGHVSYERVLSGPGLATLYRFVVRQQDRDDSWALAPSDASPEAVTRLAGEHNDPGALAAIRLYAELLGAFAGNAALQSLATGGVYFAGGVATRLHPYLIGEPLAGTFADKGRMQSLLEAIPLKAVTGGEPGLAGITRLAIREHATGAG